MSSFFCSLRQNGGAQGICSRAVGRASPHTVRPGAAEPGPPNQAQPVEITALEPGHHPRIINQGERYVEEDAVFRDGCGRLSGVGLTTGLVASYMGLSVPVFSSAAGPDELQYVPANAAVVAYANVREVMNSDFRQRFRKLEPDTAERDEFQQKTGINIEQDIDSVGGRGHAGRIADSQSWSPENSVVVIARGRFEQSRLEALAARTRRQG